MVAIVGARLHQTLFVKPGKRFMFFGKWTCIMWMIVKHTRTEVIGEMREQIFRVMLREPCRKRKPDTHVLQWTHESLKSAPPSPYHASASFQKPQHENILAPSELILKERCFIKGSPCYLWVPGVHMALREETVSKAHIDDYPFPGEFCSFPLVFHEEIIETEIGKIQWIVSTVREAMLSMLSNFSSQKQYSFPTFCRSCPFVSHSEWSAMLAPFISRTVPSLSEVSCVSTYNTWQKIAKQLLSWVTTLFSCWFVAKTEVSNQLNEINVGCRLCRQTGNMEKCRPQENECRNNLRLGDRMWVAILRQSSKEQMELKPGFEAQQVGRWIETQRWRKPPLIENLIRDMLC